MNDPNPDLSVSVNLKAILGTAIMLGPVITALVFVLQLRQDVRANTVRVTTLEGTVADLKERTAALEKAKLVYCIESRRDTARRSTDAGC